MSSPADDLAAASRTLARKAMGDATAAREFAGNSDITDEDLLDAEPLGPSRLGGWVRGPLRRASAI